MFFHAEERGFPAVHRVAFRAFAFFGTIRELRFVGIGLMAINAICKGHGLLEVPIRVAGGAGNLDVFAEQGILCFRMIEIEAR